MPPAVPIPTRLLYIGAAGEHLVMSECFRSNMEAFKLPIDKGFDLVVTQAYRHLDRHAVSARRRASPAPDTAPIYLQVKSRQADPTVSSQFPAARPAWEGCFPIKRSDLDLICDTPNSGLACVLFVPVRGALLRGRTAYAWWMSSAYVSDLRERGHFIGHPGDECLELWVKYVEPKRDSGRRENIYVSLLKQHGGAAPIGERSSGDLLAPELFDFSQLPSLLSTPGSDH